MRRLAIIVPVALFASAALLLASLGPGVFLLASLWPSYAAQADTIRLALPMKGNWDTSIAEWGARQGFFKEQGLDLDITYTQGGASNEQAVISGSVDLGVATGTLGIISALHEGRARPHHRRRNDRRPRHVFLTRSQQRHQKPRDRTARPSPTAIPGRRAESRHPALLQQGTAYPTPSRSPPAAASKYFHPGHVRPARYRPRRAADRHRGVERGQDPWS